MGVINRPLGAGLSTHSGVTCPPLLACRCTTGPRRCLRCCSTCGPIRCAGCHTSHPRNTPWVRKTGSHSPESTKVSLFTMSHTTRNSHHPPWHPSHTPGLLPCFLPQPYIQADGRVSKNLPGRPFSSIFVLPPSCSPPSFHPFSLVFLLHSPVLP